MVTWLILTSVQSSKLIEVNRRKLSKYNEMGIEKRNTEKTGHISHVEIWTEINDSIVLNCSLRVNKDQHVQLKFIKLKNKFVTPYI